MLVEYKLKVGQDEFLLRKEVQDEMDFFKQFSFYANLPKTGPNGEDDLRIVHRTTKEGYNYYFLVSEKAGQEFKFGQVNDKDGGLYPKGWTPLYQKEQNQTQTTTPVVQYTPVVQSTQPVPQTTPIVQYTPRTTVAAPVQQPQATQPVVNPPPAVTNQANSVLSRFGLNR